MYVLICRYHLPPYDGSIESKQEQEASKAKKTGGITIVEEKAPIGFIQAFLLPNVLNYAIAFGFFKLVSCVVQLQILIPSINFS
jgi:hypothetical protein